jgi:tellurite resistance protein
VDDTQLRQQLRSLGIDPHTWRVVTLLPLVEVAWADGRVQAEERARIVRLARASEALEGDGRLVLEGWLSYRPSPAYFARGRGVLLDLLARPEARAVQVDDILDACLGVAKAAGGLFGVVATVDAKERALLAKMARELPLHETWSGLLDGLEDAEQDWADEDPTETDLQPVPVPSSPAPTEQPGGPHLLVPGSKGVRRVDLPSTLRVGRGPDNGLVIRWDDQVSRRHCTVYEEGGRWYVVDAGAANGTHVEGERVLERRLFGGEVIQVGRTGLVFGL